MTDVLIIGGGLSGSLLARHLMQQLPDLQVVVVEAKAQDVHTDEVGESTTEAGAWYLGECLGLASHLREHHINKFGLRFFLARPPHTAFHERVEFGVQTLGRGYCKLPFDGTHPPSWQLNRRRLGQLLHEQNQAAGALLLHSTLVRSVHTGSPHRVDVEGPNGLQTLTARWVIDASRTGLLTHALGPLKPVDHHFRASWAWLPGRLDPDHLSEDPGYQNRVPNDLRWRSTNHWLGEGYWVWGIPLSDGRTSIGIVSHADAPSPRTPASWLAWFDQHEPECAAQIRAIGVPEQVFQRDLSGSHAPVLILPERLARVGDAAGFLDPLYSSAIDHFALNHQLVVAAIADDIAGKPIERRCRYSNVLHERLASHYQLVYRGMYDLLGNPRVFAAKITWDNAIYFATLAPMIISGQIADPDFFSRYGSLASRAADLQQRIQDLFLEWGRRSKPSPASGTIDVGTSEHLLQPLARIRDRVPQRDLRAALEHGLVELEALAVALLRHAAADCGISLPTGPLNPYAATLDPMGFDALTRGRGCQDVPEDLNRGLEAVWL